MTTSSSAGAQSERIEAIRLRLERMLQISSGEFDLRFEFGDWDLIGDGEIVLHVERAEVVNSEYRYLKGQALHLLGHYLSDGARMLDRVRQREAEGRPHLTRLWHALEDARLENQLIARWPGTARSFDAKLPPNLGGRLMQLASPTRQIELGLYLVGRGLERSNYSPRVEGLLDQAREVIKSAARSPDPGCVLEAVTEVYALFAPHLRGELKSPPPRAGRPGHVDSTKRQDQTGGEEPSIVANGDETLAVGISGDEKELPNWYRPGSAPWFKRQLGQKTIHPRAVQTERETIVNPPPGDLEAYRILRAEVQREAGFMARRLTQIVRERIYLRYGGRHRSGKLNMAKLWKQRTGSHRLFERRVQQDSREVAFTLLIDESASMKAGDKLRMGTKAAILLGEALDQLGVPLEIIGFTTDQYEAQAALAHGLIPPHEHLTTRCSRLEHRIYKQFGEPYSAVRHRLTHLQPRHNNWDEEALLFAYRRLQAQRSERRVLIVLCDGQPNGDAAALMQVVREIEGLGGGVIGVGLGENFVHEIYPSAVVAHDFEQLAEALVQLVARSFRAERVLAA